MASQKEVSPDEVSREFQKTMSGADQLRADGLDRLHRLRAVKEASLRREEERLTRKLGANHPRVNEIRGRLRLNTALMRDLSLESKRARVEPPDVDSQTWALHGFVRNKSHIGVPNLTVSFCDPAGSRLDGLGLGCTDANGYFKIRSKNFSNVRAAYVRVLSQQGSVLYADSRALQPRAGVIDYREIILSGEEVVCIPPPEPVEPGTGTPGTGTPGTGTPGTGTPGTGTPGTGTPGTGTPGTGTPGTGTPGTGTPGTGTPGTGTPGTGTPGTGTPGTGTPGTGTPGTGALPPWTVRGTVSDGKNIFFAGMKVGMADKAGKPIAALGTRTTDENGKYEFIHPSEPFAALIKPPVDLFVQLFDAKEKVISTSAALHFEPGKGQNVNFTITPGSFAAPPKEESTETPTATKKGKPKKT
jgi:hypothetical protein